MRLLCTGISLLFLLFSSGASSTSSDEHYRIMMLLYRGMTDAEHGFMDYLRERGLDVEFVIRDAAEDPQRIPSMVEEARRLRPDLIYAFGTLTTEAVVGPEGNRESERYITDIPVIFNIVADPQGAGLVSSLTSSGRLLTGVSHLVPIAVQLRSLQALGELTRIGTLHTPNEPNAVLAVTALQALAQEQGIVTVSEAVALDELGRPQEDSIVGAVRRLVVQRPDWIYLPSDSFLIRHAGKVIQTALAAGIPVFSATEAPIREQGAMAGIVSTYYAVGNFAGYKAEQILRDNKHPATMPIESLDRFTFLVNMGTARQLRRYPPVSVFRFAEVVDSR